MTNDLRYDIGVHRLSFKGKLDELVFDKNRILEFNHRHAGALANYRICLEACRITTVSGAINHRSNLGALRNRRLRQSVVLSAALSAVAVGLHGRGALNGIPKENQTKDLINDLKRRNDRTSAQVMAEVLQTTTDELPLGEEVLIESTITEGVRVKPGKEAGGNPTIAVGVLFGKEEHRESYGLNMPQNVTLLSMGTDVIEGTTKSVKGLHSSLTTLFLTESGVKRHLPDIYVQRWMSAAYFDRFNPREVNLIEVAEIIAKSYGLSGIDRLTAYFLDRPRHYPAMDVLNKASVATPFDQDGDLLPDVILGLNDLSFPDGRGLFSMIGEIGGSAEWAIGVLPLVWRGGQAIGMLTSQSTLSRSDLSPEERWAKRFHFTEEEFMFMQDARFERKPYFTISDIMEDPFAGGISAFAAITDNYLLPFMNGVRIDLENNRISVDALAVNSLGVVECWKMVFACSDSRTRTTELLAPPKDKLEKVGGKELEKAVGEMLSQPHSRRRYRIFFNTEYYPALIPVGNRLVLLHKAIDGLIKRKALSDEDREIVAVTEKLAPEWFVTSD